MNILKNIKRKHLWGLGLGIIIIIIILVLSGKHNEVSHNDTELIPRKVKVFAAEQTDKIETKLSLQGTIRPKKFTQIRSQVSARLEYLEPIGSEVRVGQVIARLVDNDTSRAYTSALGTFSDSQGSFSETKILNLQTVNQAELSLNSTEALVEVASESLKNSISLSQEQLQQAINSASVAYSGAYNSMEQVLSFWGGGTMTDFILKRTPTANLSLLGSSEGAYFHLRDMFKKLRQVPNFDNLEQELTLMEDVVEEARLFNDRVFRILSFSLPRINGQFTQVLVNRYQAQVILFQTQINVQDASIKNAKTLLSSTKISNSSSLLTAENSLVQAEIARDNAKSSLESTLSQAEIREFSGSGQVNSASLQLAQAQGRFDDLTFRAPFSGIIISHRANEGDQVSAGKGLLEMGQLQEVEIEVLVDSKNVKLVDKEKEVLIDGKTKGIITEMSPSGSLETGKISLTVSVDNSDNIFSGGDVAEVELSLSLDIKSSFVIPLSAVTITQTESFVLVVENSIVTKKQIITGLVLDSKVQIVGGLDSGDKVIMSSGEFLTVGEGVKVTE